MKNQLTINGLNESIACCEAIGLAKCFEAYANNGCEDILDGGIGFNANSGYVYIALENGITIASMMGSEVDYIVSDVENGDEFFFNTMDEALDYLNEQ